MPKVGKHEPGSFCWVELATTDQAAAKTFYSSIFHWEPRDSPIGPDDFYTIFKLDGQPAAAAYTMRPAESAAAPPHWTLYIKVENADEAAAKAAELGGAVIDQPFDVSSAGRMAVIQDPPGAVFCLWQSKEQPGLGVTHENGAFCWADLASTDPARARAFYQGMFGWKIGPAPNYPPGYEVIDNGGPAPVGGIGPIRGGEGLPSHWMLFFIADDVDGVAAKTKELGGTVQMGPVSMGPVRMAALADPQGAAFSIIRPPAA